MKIHLVVVDPQNDFCIPDCARNQGALVVPGARQDMSRVAVMIDRLGDQIEAIHVTLDSHHTVGIERPGWWKRVKDGVPPPPFTTLTLNDAGDGVVDAAGDAYTTTIPYRFRHGPPEGYGVLGYSRALKDKGGVLTIWPVHCVIGTWGACIVPELARMLSAWEQKTSTPVNYVLKGTNPHTEHFSAVRAEVPDSEDPSTSLNVGLLRQLQQADLIAVCGEARSHCVAATVRDMIEQCPSFDRKLVLLDDAMSNVPGFEKQGDVFMEDMLARGVTVAPRCSDLWLV